MARAPKDDQYDDDEAKRRAEQALRGAFKTPPLADKAKKPKDTQPEKRK